MNENIAWRGRLILEAVSPIHIGNGEVLKSGFEYDYRDGEVVRLDVEGFLNDGAIPMFQKEDFFSGNLKPPGPEQMRKRMKPRYPLISGSGKFIGSEVREFIKSSGDKAYIPGSTMKGVFRTALAWALFSQLSPEDRQTALVCAGKTSKDQFKAQHMENLLFQEGVIRKENDGRSREERPSRVLGDAKADALKGLIVRDSESIPKLELRAYNVFVNHRGRMEAKHEAPLALEAIPHGVRFEIPICVRKDQLEVSGDYRPSEKAMKLIDDIGAFAECLFSYGRLLADVEIEFFKNAGMSQWPPFFKQGHMLPIGFGTGWNANTVGPLLKKPKEVDEARISFHRGYPPPISRRLALDAKGNPIMPIGWAKIVKVKED